MKKITRGFLQQILGFNNYLFLFSLYKIFTLRFDKGENDFLHFVNLFTEEDGIILDIGANIGLMSVTLGRRFPKASIYSFEPVSYNLDTLKKNIQYFGLKNIKLFDTALGNQNGKIEMVLPEVGGSKMHGFCHVIDGSIPKGEKFIMDVKKLDDIKEINKPSRRIAGMKIDVEHFEWAVLEGSIGMLKANKPIIYGELAANSNRIKSFEILTKLGYKSM